MGVLGVLSYVDLKKYFTTLSTLNKRFWNFMLSTQKQIYELSTHAHDSCIPMYFYFYHFLAFHKNKYNFIIENLHHNKQNNIPIYIVVYTPP